MPGDPQESPLEIHPRLIGEALDPRGLASPLFSSLLAEAEAGVAFVGLDGRVILVNPALAEFTGRPATDHIGRTCAELVPAIAGQCETALEHALKGEHWVFEVSSTRRLVGDVYRAWSTEWYPVRDACGETIAVGVLVRETTSQRRVELALANAYAQLAALVNTVPVGLAVFDGRLQVVQMNKVLAEWNDIDVYTALGRRAAELTPAVWPTMHCYFDAALSGERVEVEIDRRALGVARGPSNLFVTYAPVAHQGSIVGVIVCAVDVSERVAHERALGAALAQLEAIFSNVPVAIGLFDVELRALRLNRLMADWLHVEPDESVGKQARDLFGTLWPALRDNFDSVMRGESLEVDVDRRALGQRYGPALVSHSYTPVYADGDLVGVALTSADITDRETAIRFRDDLMSIASHELRTPLTSIVAFSERLRRLASRPEGLAISDALEDLTLIHSESERMARMLDLVFDMVGLAAGSAPIDREPVSLASLVRRQAHMTHERHPELQLELQVVNEPIVDSDGDRIAQVITNLLENAFRYAGESAHVTIRVYADDKMGCIDVQDDGPGIAPEEQELIFMRRYRGHQADDAGGLGLGLYLSRLIATQLGGTLVVTSALGKGATFTLRLPLDASD